MNTYVSYVEGIGEYQFQAPSLQAAAEHIYKLYGKRAHPPKLVKKGA